MVRHRGYIQADKFRQIGHASLPIAERVDDEQAGRIAQGLEHICCFTEIRLLFAFRGFERDLHASFFASLPNNVKLRFCADIAVPSLRLSPAGS